MYLICLNKYKRHQKFDIGATDLQEGLGTVERETKQNWKLKIKWKNGRLNG